MKMMYILCYKGFNISYNPATRHQSTGGSSTAYITKHHTTPCFPTPPSRDTPKQDTTITTPPPQLQEPKDPSTLPSGEHRGRLQRTKTLHPRGSGDDLHGMHVAHAVVGPIEKDSFSWMRGAEGGRSADWSNRVGSSEERGAGRRGPIWSRTPPWWRRGRGRAWTVDYARGWSVNLGGTLLSPWRMSLLVFPNKGGISVVLLSVSELVDTWSDTLGFIGNCCLSTRSRCEGLVPCSRGQ